MRSNRIDEALYGTKYSSFGNGKKPCGCGCGGANTNGIPSSEFFLSSTAGTVIGNVNLVVLCVINLGGSGGSFRQCRRDLTLAEACKWMQVCESVYPGNWADWSIDGGSTAQCFM